MNREHHVPPHSTRSALGISNEAVRLRLMAAIVSLRKQVFAHASDSDVSAKPLLRSAAEPNNVHQPRDLPYLQLQTQPGGAALQQRDISSFFRPPIASANSKDADEYVYDIYILYNCKHFNFWCMYAKVFVSWPHYASGGPCSTQLGGVPVGHLVPGSRFTVDFFKREVLP